MSPKSPDSTPQPGQTGTFRAPRVACHAQHARRLFIASTVFALSLLTTLVLVAAFILRDLSEDRVNRMLTQAKDEAEAVARMANDPGTMGEGETVDAVDAGQGREIDAQALLNDMMPDMYDESGKKVKPFADSPLLGPGQGLPGDTPGGPASAMRRRVPANLSRQGQEWQTLVNGELVRRDAFQYIEIKYPGGKQILSFRRSDLKDFDRRILDDPSTHAERLVKLYRPSSQRITLAWDSTIDGQPVKLQAGIDASVLQEGVDELRRRTIPKVIAGAGAFVVLLGIAYFYVFRLLGEARRLEAEASQQALLAQVGMLAAGLAHEIRNPLSAVQMNLQLLQEDIEEGAIGQPPAAPAAAKNGAMASELPTGAGDHVALLQATQREIRRLGTLVSDFLTYARPATPRPAAVRPDTLVRDCAELFRANAAGLGVSLDLDLQSGEDPVLLDEAMVKQALMNVIKNAIEAAPQPGGRVVVTTRRAAGMLQVAVTDNGPGVPEDPEEMFRVFHSTKKGGTGLGLPISRALVERQRGTLVARQAASGGALFVLTLPTGAPAPAEAGA